MTVSGYRDPCAAGIGALAVPVRTAVAGGGGTHRVITPVLIDATGDVPAQTPAAAGSFIREPIFAVGGIAPNKLISVTVDYFNC